MNRSERVRAKNFKFMALKREKMLMEKAFPLVQWM
jgi:hypothetical protein